MHKNKPGRKGQLRMVFPFSFPKAAAATAFANNFSRSFRLSIDCNTSNSTAIPVTGNHEQHTLTFSSQC